MKPKLLHSSLMAAAAAILLAAPNGNAAMLNYAGSFNASGGSHTTPAISSLSGSFDFLFDDSVLTGVGFEFFQPIPLSNFSFTPDPLGGTSFTTANSAARLFFYNGVLAELIVGGTINRVGVIEPNTDDWWADFDSAGNLFNVTAIVASESGDYAGFNAFSEASLTGSFSVREVPSSVPEPSSAIAGILAAVGLFSLRKVNPRRTSVSFLLSRGYRSQPARP